MRDVHVNPDLCGSPHPTAARRRSDLRCDPPGSRGQWLTVAADDSEVCPKRASKSRRRLLTRTELCAKRPKNSGAIAAKSPTRLSCRWVILQLRERLPTAAFKMAVCLHDRLRRNIYRRKLSRRAQSIPRKLLDREVCALYLFSHLFR